MYNNIDMVVTGNLKLILQNFWSKESLRFQANEILHSEPIKKACFPANEISYSEIIKTIAFQTMNTLDWPTNDIQLTWGNKG